MVISNDRNSSNLRGNIKSLVIFKIYGIELALCLWKAKTESVEPGKYTLFYLPNYGFWSKTIKAKNCTINLSSKIFGHLNKT